MEPSTGSSWPVLSAPFGQVEPVLVNPGTLLPHSLERERL
jgi:hypothetical protein